MDAASSSYNGDNEFNVDFERKERILLTLLAWDIRRRKLAEETLRPTVPDSENVRLFSSPPSGVEGSSGGRNSPNSPAPRKVARAARSSSYTSAKSGSLRSSTSFLFKSNRMVFTHSSS